MSESALAVSAPTFSQSQIDLIKRTVAPPDATVDELKLFLHVAARAGLDPLAKQIHMTKRAGKLTIIAGIDGLRARALREADFEGLLHGVVCAKDVLEYDAVTGVVLKHTHNPFADRGPVLGAWATVKRKGRLPFTATVKFAEFCQPASPTWKSMPYVMIDKVAQSTALRMAYPEQFSAIYEQAEMDQSETPPPVVGAATAALKEKLALAVPMDVPAEVVEAPAPARRASRMTIVDEGPPPPSDDDVPWGAGIPKPSPPPAAPPTQSDFQEDEPMTFGLGSGKPLASLSTKELAWYAKALAENVANPDKARWKDANAAALASIKREQARRT